MYLTLCALLILVIGAAAVLRPPTRSRTHLGGLGYLAAPIVAEAPWLGFAAITRAKEGH
jgi:hypothetical protein